MFPILRSPQNPLDTFLWIFHFLSLSFWLPQNTRTPNNEFYFISKYRNCIFFSFVAVVGSFYSKCVASINDLLLSFFHVSSSFGNREKTFMVITAFYTLFEVKDFSVFMFTSYNRSFVNIVIIFKDIWRHFLMVTYWKREM